jgi:hypothetical protein
VIALALAAVSLLAPASAGAGGVRSPLALAASPAHVRLVGSAAATLRVTNWGSARVVADVGTAGFALGLRGRPRIVRRPAGRRVAASWLTVRPRRLTLPAGSTAVLTVSSTLPRRAEPGDHPALVLVTTRPRPGSRIGVRMEIGVVVVVRVPGTVVHRLALGSLRVRRHRGTRMLELGIANHGNVTEAVGPGRLRVQVLRGDRVVGRARPSRREFLPRSQGIEEIAYRGRVSGPVTVLVELRRGGRTVRRMFHLRL